MNRFRAGLAALTLVAGLGFGPGAALAADPEDSPAEIQASHGGAGLVPVLVEAFGDIDEYYLDPVSPERAALAALGNLDPAGHSVTAEAGAAWIVLRAGKTEFFRAGRPQSQDAQGWADLVGDAVAAARRDLPPLAHLTDEEAEKRLFEGMIQRLDRYTRYAGPEAADEQRAQRDGFGGIGILLDYANGDPRVSEVLPDGPAARGGMQVDDHLIAVDGRSLSGLKVGEVPSRLRGPVGSRVAITVLRGGPPMKTVTLQLVRALVVPPTVTAALLPGDFAIFHISLFNHDTGATLAQQIEAMRAAAHDRLKGAVLDLRDNPGGLLDQGVEVASLFLDGGPIVRTTGRNPRSLQSFSGTDHDRLRGLPVAVLVDGGSASAAEIVASALQDRGRAVVVGSSSYGKGTVQMVLALPNEGELTLTWARMMTPGGYTLHQHGVVPAFCTENPLGDWHGGDGRQQNPRDRAIVDRAMVGGDEVVQHLLARARTADQLHLSRPALNDAQWAALRASCPPTTEPSPFDVVIAERVLADPHLYAEALGARGVALAGSVHTAAVGARQVQ